KESGLHRPLKLLFPLTLIGLIMTIRFTYLQFFVIEALCTYCLFSALTSTTLFVLAWLMRRK
ncbi:Vitamin K epoxide reductase, partial [Patescibacteria group bacterium]|nr:Vitamin K epoxide reductase [Patescibacteria group bacterium]